MNANSGELAVFGIMIPFFVAGILFLSYKSIVFRGTPDEIKDKKNKLLYSAIAFLVLGVLIVSGSVLYISR